MPKIRPISDLRNKANEISDFCREEHEPVYITKNGTGDMVILNIDEYERQLMLLSLYGNLSEAEAEVNNGEEGEEFSAFAKKLRKSVNGI